MANDTGQNTAWTNNVASSLHQVIVGDQDVLSRLNAVLGVVNNFFERRIEEPVHTLTNNAAGTVATGLVSLGRSVLPIGYV